MEIKVMLVGKKFLLPDNKTVYVENPKALIKTNIQKPPRINK